MGLFGLHLPKKVDNVFGAIGNQSSAIGHQIDPLDNGATYNTVRQGIQARPGPSVANQIGQFGAGLAKPFVATGADLSNAVGNAEVGIAHRFGVAPNIKTQTNIQQYGQNLGSYVGQNTPLNFSKNAVQIALTVATPGISRFAETGVAKILPAVVPRLASRTIANVAVGTPTGGLFNTLNGGSFKSGAEGGALLGGLGTLAEPVTRSGGQVVVKATNNRVPLGNYALNDSNIGAVGKNVNTGKVSIKPLSDQSKQKVKVLSPAPPIESPSTPVSIKTKQPTGQATAEQIGRALGMSDQEIAQVLLTNASPPRPGTDMHSEGLADLPPKEQMALHASQTPLAPVEVNTAANPYKSLATPVQAGGYSHAIANSQLVSRPIDTARTVLTDTLKQLKKTSPDEYNSFWRSVENPTNPNYSPLLKNAIDQWRNVDNKVHGESQALGGNTNYLTEHSLHPWQLPEEFTNHIVNGGSPASFKGLNNISRKYRTIAEGEAKGLKLGQDPLGEANRYLQANSAILRKISLKQGLSQADSHQTLQPVTLDLGNGHSVQLSKEGASQARGVQYHVPSSNPVIKSVRTASQGVKTTILSGGQFHTINIGLLRSVPTLLGAGHPRAAATAIYDALRGSFSKQYADRVVGNAIKDGTVDKAALIGMPFGSTGYEPEGTFLKHGVGHQLVFNQQIPMFHNQLARSIISDLEKRGIPLNSEEARLAGRSGNNTLGFINKEAQKIPPNVNQGLSDLLLAKQFTHSKFSQVRNVGAAATHKGTGVAGKYAAANIAGNVAAATGIIVGAGYLLKQPADNVRDSLLRALVDPAVASNQQDNKGNTIKYRLPGTDTSDIAKLLGIKLARSSDGHLGVNFNPKNVPAGVTDFARARLSPFASAGVKVASNTTYAGKPLYDPSANPGVKFQQGATSVLSGMLPIGAQGIPLTKPVKDRLPGNIQNVLNAQTPGTNPLAKSIGSSFGFTPATDQTVGKGLQSSQYFSALKDAQGGLNGHEKAALELYSGAKKNPVTGKYDVLPNPNDTQTKARALLDQPKVIGNLMAMNNKLQSQGQKIDPLWAQSKEDITKVLQYQAMPPGGADRTHWLSENKSWYVPLSDQRTAFFNTLPKGDLNKPQQPIEYPKTSPQVADQQKQFFNLTDSKARASYLQDHPEVQSQLDKQVEYNNQMRTATGYSPLDTYPTASPQVQKVIDTYNAIPKGGGKKGGNLYRSRWIQAHPQEYGAMSQYFTQASLYGLEKDAVQAQFKDTGFSSKGLGDIYNLGQHDIGKQTDQNGNTFYALGGNTSNSGSYGYGPKQINPSTYGHRISVKPAPNLARQVSVKKVVARPKGAGTGKIKVISKKAAV